MVDFIKTAYESTTQRLLSLLENEEITNDLLWALFKPNSKVYTTCFGTGKPRCVICDGGEENETDYGVKYYNMECRYLDYDGKVFGEACESKLALTLGTDFPATPNPDAQQQFQWAAFADLSVPTGPSTQQAGDRPFDVLDRRPQFLSYQHYFIDHAQLSGPVQAIAAFVNIHLPF